MEARCAAACEPPDDLAAAKAPKTLAVLGVGAVEVEKRGGHAS
jgi:hypothetical protein